MKTYGGAELQMQVLMTSTVGGGRVLASRSRRVSVGEEPQSRSGRCGVQTMLCSHRTWIRDPSQRRHVLSAVNQSQRRKLRASCERQNM
jgi:hypothetical protein